jgi:hypothetical protein
MSRLDIFGDRKVSKNCNHAILHYEVRKVGSNLPICSFFQLKTLLRMIFQVAPYCHFTVIVKAPSGLGFFTRYKFPANFLGINEDKLFLSSAVSLMRVVWFFRICIFE